MDMPDEASEIRFVVKLCDDREGQSTVYSIVFFPILVNLVFSEISAFSESGWSWSDITVITLCSFYIILGVFSLVSDGFSWFRSRASYKKNNEAVFIFGRNEGCY
jgi:amino acid permease